MLPSTLLSRRDLFRLGAAAAAVSLLPASGRAQTKTAAATADDLQGAGFYTFRVGDLTVTLLSDGTFPMNPAELVAGTTPDEIADAQRDAFLPPGPITGHINGLLIHTGADLVLVDTGCGTGFGPTTGKIGQRLAHVGVRPADVTKVVLTHLHPDHVGGLIAPVGDFALPNAEVFVSPQERAFWSDAAPDLSGSLAPPELKAMVTAVAARALVLLKDRLSDLKPDAEIAPGVTAVAAPGHTPGHTGVFIASGDASLLYLTDAIHMPQIQLAHPAWRVVYDTDAAQAVDTRRKLFDRAAVDRALVAGAHLPFPALGHVRAEGAGYAWVPATWQWGA